MAQRTIMGLYEGYDAVVQIAHRLELAGVPDRDISVVTSNTDSRFPVLAEAAQRGGAALRAGVVIGATLGLCCGILLAIGAPGIAVPGAIAGAGWLAALLCGAAAGAVAGLAIGGAVRLVVRRDPAVVYAQGISRGSTLLTVRVPDAIAPRVERLMGIGSEAAPAQGHGARRWGRHEPGPTNLGVWRRRIDATHARQDG